MNDTFIFADNPERGCVRLYTYDEFISQMFSVALTNVDELVIEALKDIFDAAVMNIVELPGAVGVTDGAPIAKLSISIVMPIIKISFLICIPVLL